MFGILYILLSFLTGREAAVFLLKEKNNFEKKGNLVWVLAAASFGAGILFNTWAVYITAWLFSVLTPVDEPLLYGNILVMLFCVMILSLVYLKRKKEGKEKGSSIRLVESIPLLKKEVIFYGLLMAFVLYMMFYVFYVQDGVLYSGFTVFGDYAPHTAMMRSFSIGENFPTQYPHFGGADVRYHFMFQFLIGNLEYLGLRIDVAYNLVSTLSMVGFLMLLGQIAFRLTGRFGAGVWASLLFFFRSGTAFFQFVLEHLKKGDLLEAFVQNREFIGYTTNENWGLWNFNVYLNQRHLAFGLLILGIAIWVFWDHLEAGTAHQEKGWIWLRGRVFSLAAWRSRNLEKALLLGLMIGLTSFWNGAAVIGGLLILLGFSAFSDGKTDYGVMAFTAVLFSLLQSRIFISGEAMSPSLYWGFLAEEKSLSGVLWYLIQISGCFVAGLVLLIFWMRRKERILLLAFLFPLLFAFGVSLTPDINVNHKYIMISWAFLTVFWGGILVRLWRGRFLKKAAVFFLAAALTATGVYDFVIILRNNGSGRRVTVDMESDVTKWLGEHLTSQDLILTPEYSMSEVTMSGVMMYCGWPYYAWSAGYDTNYRAAVATEMYITEDVQRLKELAVQEGITYILFQEDMTFEGQKGREETIRKAYPRVYRSEDGRIRIYEV